MRNEPKGGIREEDSHYLPGYTTGFYGYDPETSRSKIQDLHHDIRRSSSINDACNEVSEKWHTKLAELSKLNATHLDDLDDEDIEKLLPIAIKMRKEQMSLEEGFLDTFLGRNMKRQNEELDESVYDKKLTQAWKKLLSVPNVRGISNSGQNHAKKLSSLLKGSPDNLTFEKLELALGTYETHAYKAAEDKKNPHGKEDLAKLEEFSNSVDDVIGAMKNLHQSQLPEGFLDTFLGRNMKKGNVDKKKSKKSKNSEQVKLSTEIDRKLRLIDDLMKKVRPLGGNLGRLMAFRKLPIDKMTPKGMYVALNDWWDSIEADLDDDSEDDNEKYAQSAEKLYDLWEEVGFKLSDYMWASGYNVKGIGQMAKIGFPAKKRTDPEWLKMNESVDEGFMDTMKQLVPGARNPQKPQEGKKTAMQMQFPYARLSVHRMIVALRKARGTAMKGKAQGKDRRENERSLGYILAHVEDIARTRHAEQPNSGRQIHDTRNIDDQTQSYFMDKIRQNDWTKADQEILNAMVGNGTDDYTKGGAYHARTLAHDIALSVKYAKKDAGINESVDLDENFIAFDYEHEVLTHFQTKADGMKWKNHKNAPDSYYLVKTKHRLLKGDMASDGSDSLSKHLDSQPFPEKDGANFSVHKESVDLDESVYDKKLMQSWKKVKSLPNVRGISNSGQSHAKKLSSLLKGSPDKLTFEKLELALGNYETHAYKAAEDKKNPHGKEDLVKLEEFSNSVDDVIGAMKNLHQSQLPEGFMDTMKQLVPGAKGKPAKGEPAKKLNAEQVKISKQIDKKLKLIDNLVQKVRPLGGQISGLVRFSRLPLEKMNPKDLYRVLNDWYDSIEHELDYGDDSVVLSKKYGRSVENLHERMEELALKIKDYMYASGYDVPHGGAKFQYKWLNKVDFSAPKRTDAKWLKMNESVDEALNMHELR